MTRKLRQGLSLAILGILASACGVPRGAAGDTEKKATAAVEAPSTDIKPLTVPVEAWTDLVSPTAFNVLFHEGTEPPFTSPLNDEHRDGTFVCSACYLPLFSSKAKFESGTGWPSFLEPIAGHVAFAEDHKLIVARTEYHCIRCGGHQGHVFDDGPKPTGQRWCNNGVAIRFIPADEDLPALRGGAEAATGSAPGIKYTEKEEWIDGEDVAIFAGGCFWCVETAFEGIPGVFSAVSGYTGGHTRNPTYEQVNTHTTGHVEAVQVTYDPAKISYDQLLDIFWHNVDPTSAHGQFCDRGDTYVSAIFYRDEAQHGLAEASLERAKKWLKVDKPIVTELRPAAEFWVAEDYHQDYYRKNPENYHAYRTGCGRDARLKQLWGEAPAGH